MGILKEITSVIKDKAKDEILLYIKKLQEENEKKEDVEKAEEVSQQKTPVVEENVIEKEPEVLIPEQKKEEFLPRICKEDIYKVNIKITGNKIPVDIDFTDSLQQLSEEELAFYLKIYFYSFTQKKNFGYVGKTLRKKLRISDEEHDEFIAKMEKLEQRGLLITEEVSQTQTVYVLYMPYDEEIMEKVAGTTPKMKERPASKSSDKSGNHSPGRPETGMDDDALMKAYNTFVSLEIDKAKMRVGRSNFDRIYMEAVKYIDKRYGFQILSNNEKMKEYLTQYYVSAFDIPSFEEWKRGNGKR